MTYTGIRLHGNDLNTILTILNSEADRRKALWEGMRGTDCEELAANQYCDCIRAYTELQVQKEDAERRRNFTCEIKSGAES